MQITRCTPGVRPHPPDRRHLVHAGPYCVPARHPAFSHRLGQSGSGVRRFGEPRRRPSSALMWSVRDHRPARRAAVFFTDRPGRPGPRRSAFPSRSLDSVAAPRTAIAARRIASWYRSPAARRSCQRLALLARVCGWQSRQPAPGHWHRGGPRGGCVGCRCLSVCRTCRPASTRFRNAIAGLLAVARLPGPPTVRAPSVPAGRPGSPWSPGSWSSTPGRRGAARRTPRPATARRVAAPPRPAAGRPVPRGAGPRVVQDRDGETERGQPILISGSAAR
jgi:hypothetical protein